MQLGELEKAVRIAARSSPTQPPLAVVTANGQWNLRLPAEFDTAAKSLVEQMRQEATESSTERTPTYEWF